MKALGPTLAMFWVAHDLENVSSSVLLSSGLALGDDEALDEEVETKFRHGPNIDFRPFFFIIKSSILSALHETEECLGIDFVLAVTLGPETIGLLSIPSFMFQPALT